jgi:biopolymer transport protein ExbB
MDELDQAGLAEISRMERRLSVLALIAQIAPLLGLLGTVLGILAALISMRDAAPFIDARALTDGLILGAITTLAGLLVSIPSFVGFNVLVVKIDRLVLDMRHASSEALYFFSRKTSANEEQTGE